MKPKTVKLVPALCLCIVIVMLFTGCIYINWGSAENVVGNGQMATREVAVKDALTGIVNNGSFDVEIDTALEGKAVVEGESNIIELVQVVQDSRGIMTVSLNPGINIIHFRRVVVRVPMLKGGYAEMNGSGSIAYKGDKPVESENFELRVNGSGDIQLRVQGKGLRANINGSGNIDVSGTTEDEDIVINGSGDFNGFGLIAQNAEISISGSGNADVHAEKTITGSIVGSGDITYEGEPSINVSEHGSGTCKSVKTLLETVSISRVFFIPSVAEKKRDICGYHKRVQAVEHDYGVHGIQRFVYDSGNIARNQYE